VTAASADNGPAAGSESRSRSTPQVSHCMANSAVNTFAEIETSPERTFRSHILHILLLLLFLLNLFIFLDFIPTVLVHNLEL
jgi:hypothetical protein